MVTDIRVAGWPRTTPCSKRRTVMHDIKNWTNPTCIDQSLEFMRSKWFESFPSWYFIAALIEWHPTKGKPIESSKASQVLWKHSSSEPNRNGWSQMPAVVLRPITMFLTINMSSMGWGETNVEWGTAQREHFCVLNATKGSTTRTRLRSRARSERELIFRLIQWLGSPSKPLCS